MSKQKRVRQFQPMTTTAARFQALREGRLHGVRVWETITATHTPTAARLRGGGWKHPQNPTTRGNG